MPRKRRLLSRGDRSCDDLLAALSLDDVFAVRLTSCDCFGVGSRERASSRDSRGRRAASAGRRVVDLSWRALLASALTVCAGRDGVRGAVAGVDLGGRGSQR